MIKKLLTAIVFIFFTMVKSQNNFEYIRIWGTYVGPISSFSWAHGYGTNSLLFDSQDNIYNLSFVSVNTAYPQSYYQQFVMGGGQSFQLPSGTYPGVFTEAKFNNSGVLQYFGYCGPNQFKSGMHTKRLACIDQNDNKYYIYRCFPADLPITVSSNAWITTSTMYALAKYDATNNLLWATYLPDQTHLIEVDENENIYISGYVSNGSNISTTGTYQDNYQNMVNSGNPNGCGYIVKLNPSGQKTWGTFVPGSIGNIKVFNGGVYVLASNIPNTNTLPITTANTFQTTAASYSISKLDANSGARDWGTYYGTSSTGGITDMNVNSTGVYVLGHEYDYTNNTNYYGTAGSYHPTNSGGIDMFLSRFSLTGNRLWSTYIGGTATDLSQDQIKSIALDGNNIFISGHFWGQNAIFSTSNSVHQQYPEYNSSSYSNHFFSKFNTDGVLQWYSYYGGSGHSGQEMNIALHNSMLYLYGSTDGTNLFTTPGSSQPQFINPYPAVTTGSQKVIPFLAKFNLKTLDTSEVVKKEDISLYDNPNNGNFSLKGYLFSKNDVQISIFDISGKLVHKSFLKRTNDNEHKIFLQNNLSKGNYILNITNENGFLIKNFKMIVK